MEECVRDAVAVVRSLHATGASQQQYLHDLAARLDNCFSCEQDSSQAEYAAGTSQTTAAAAAERERFQVALQQLLAEYQTHRAVAEEVQDAMELQAKEYTAEALRLTELLHAAGIHPELFPPSTRDSLAAVSGIANELDVALVSENSLAAAWGQLCVEDMKAARMQLMLQQKQSELSRLTRAAAASSQQLQEAVAAAQERLQRADKKLEQQALQYLPDVPLKLQKYRDQAAQHQRKLEASGWRPELKHSALVQRHELLEQLEEELRQKQADLEAFHGVQPSVDGAQRQLQLSKANLIVLQQRLHSGLGLQE